MSSPAMQERNCPSLQITPLIQRMLWALITLVSTIPLSNAETLIYNEEIPDNSSIDPQSYDNQMNWTQFRFLAEEGSLSGTYQFAEGVYDLSTAITLPPQEGWVTLRGGPDVLFKGSYSAETPLELTGGFILAAKRVTFDQLNFSDVSSCIQVKEESTANNIVITNLSAYNTHTCILLDQNKNIRADNWNLYNISIQNYFRTGVRISGQKTKNIFLDNFFIDGTREARSHCYKGGIQILAGAQHVKIKNGEIHNTAGTCGQRYQQGDGIEIDDSYGTPHHIFIKNTQVVNSADANFDLKGRYVTMENVTSISTIGSQSGFKLWSYGQYVCKSCDIQGNYTAMLRLISASAVFTWVDPSVTEAPNYRLVYESPNSPPVWE